MIPISTTPFEIRHLEELLKCAALGGPPRNHPGSSEGRINATLTPGGTACERVYSIGGRAECTVILMVRNCGGSFGK